MKVWACFHRKALVGIASNFMTAYVWLEQHGDVENDKELYFVKRNVTFIKEYQLDEGI